MRLHVFSDLHFDAMPGGWVPQLPPGADAVLCAGDVCEGLPEAFAYLRRSIPEPTPIITVAGNHSFYRRVLRDELEAGRAAAREHGVTLLSDALAILGGVRFIGATLWTDYRLFGEGSRVFCMDAARRGLNDHRRIAWQKDPWLRFRPEEAARLHDASVSFLATALTEPFEGATVVLTHHAPLPRSVPERYARDLLSGAYASDLSALIGRWQPTLWVHGHTHTSFDYRAGETRIVCNPHGYGRENAEGFDPALILDVAAAAR